MKRSVIIGLDINFLVNKAKRFQTHRGLTEERIVFLISFSEHAETVGGSANGCVSAPTASLLKGCTSRPKMGSGIRPGVQEAHFCKSSGANLRNCKLKKALTIIPTRWFRKRRRSPIVRWVNRSSFSDRNTAYHRFGNRSLKYVDRYSSRLRKTSKRNSNVSNAFCLGGLVEDSHEEKEFLNIV